MTISVDEAMSRPSEDIVVLLQNPYTEKYAALQALRGCSHDILQPPDSQAPTSYPSSCFSVVTLNTVALDMLGVL